MRSYNGFDPAIRNKANRWLNGEYASGRVQRPTKCDNCGQDKGVIDHHAEDYSEPFGPHIYEFGLCVRCHFWLHCRFSNREGYERYKAALRKGYTFDPVPGRNFEVFKVHLQQGNSAVKYTFTGKRPELLFDAIEKRKHPEPRKPVPPAPTLKQASMFDDVKPRIRFPD